MVIPKSNPYREEQESYDIYVCSQMSLYSSGSNLA